MRWMDEFAREELAKGLIDRIHRLAQRLGRPITIMEVCGTHTVALFRHGVRAALPKNLRMISGPGCPVCVTPNEEIDTAIEMALKPDVILVTFGDMVRVPGSRKSLADARIEGADIRVVYSPLEALDIARANPERQIVFLGVGFETTAPTIGATINQAASEELANFSVFSAHKLVPPAMRALVLSGEVGVDGFMLPGHVCTVIGARPFEFLADEFGIPGMVTGFQPLDLLQGIAMLLDQIANDRHRIEIEYTRIVSREGNRQAQAILEKVFTPGDASWRGFGLLPSSGLHLSPTYSQFDAKRRIEVKIPPPVEHRGCRCDAVIRGALEPEECRLFRKVCTPEYPIGPCMVSSEGTCAAHFKYGEAQHPHPIEPPLEVKP